MNRLQAAARRLSIITSRLARRVVVLLPDLHVYAGIALLAYGMAQLATWGPVLAPIVAGLGLIWIVRFGADPGPRR